MALGLKRNETRGVRWSTLGCDIAICAAKRPIDQDGLALARLHNISLVAMPFGAVVCVVFMQNPKPSHLFGDAELSPQEYALGNYEPGRWIYETGLLRRLDKPIHVIGRQGIFNLPADVEAKVKSQL